MIDLASERLAVLVILVSTVGCLEVIDGLLGGTGSADDEADDGAGDCNPGDPGEEEPCGAGQLCCSDDPAALELALLDQFVTPQYQGGGGEGVPIFSAANNSRATRGTCEEPSDPPGALTEVEAQGCPIPCNPTWADADVQRVCGPSSSCCQTLAIEVDDCVLDPTIGESGCWRPVTGADIVGLGGINATPWTDLAHATEQDPGGHSCQTFVSGISQATLDEAGVSADMVLLACYRRLSVANQRGHCIDAGTMCPLDPATPDACELRNEQESRTDCAELLP